MTDNLKILRKNLSDVNMSLNGAMMIDLSSDIHNKVSDIKNKVEELLKEIDGIKYYKFHIVNGSNYAYVYFYTGIDINDFDDVYDFIESINDLEIMSKIHTDHYNLNTIEIISESEYNNIRREYVENGSEEIELLSNDVYYKHSESESVVKVIRPENDFREVKD